MKKDDFIKRAREIHGDKYDYSLLPEEFGTKEKVTIICPEHGEFLKDFGHHYYRKQGCPECAGKKRYSNSEFIEKIKKLPNTKEVSFEKCQYVNNKTKVILTCHHKDSDGNEHGDFEITPGHLLDGEGCPVCRYIKSSSALRRSIEELISDARKVHGDRYDYSMITEYKNDRLKYPIICPEHGVFYQAMNNHIKGKQGCPVCGKIKQGAEQRITFEEFVERANKVHDGYYTYDESSYTLFTDYVGIICPKHGYFKQNGSNHINLGYGCPKCGNIISKGEKEVLNYIKKVYDGVVEENKTGIFSDNREVDIYIPEQKIAFEYDGLYWHSEIRKEKNYHLIKTKECEEKGIHLFHIFEDEWFYKSDIVKSMIKNLLGLIDNKIYARCCEIREVGFTDSKKFLNENHLQGHTPSAKRYGLYYNDELVSLMTFGKSRHFIGNNQDKWELIRFCNKINTNVVGGASKLFKHFIKENSVNEIISYADRRWSNGKIYGILGFTKYNESAPNYYYIKRRKRIYRFNLRKSVLIEKYGCPEDMTEREFCKEHNIYRIYDCGCLCYVWKKKK